MRPNTIEREQRPDLGLGYVLREPARTALLDLLDRWDLLGAAVDRWLQSLAVGHPDQIPDHMVRRFGQGAHLVALATERCVSDPVWAGMHVDQPPGWYVWLLKAPDWYFARFLEKAVFALPDGAGRFDRPSSRETLRAELNDLLANAGGQFAIDEQGRAVAPHEPHIDEEVLQPALAMLAQPRLVNVRRDFDAATAALAAGTPEADERAIAEATNAVEGMLAVLMDERGVSARGDATQARFNALRDAGVLSTYHESLICGTARIRNKTASHSRENTPRDADHNDARGSVQAAAVALVFLEGVRQTP